MYSSNQLIVTVSRNGIRTWRHRTGRLHNPDGPAVICPDGEERWYYDGILHREGGPAIEGPGFSRVWYRHGVYHCETGPAVVVPGGCPAYYINGRELGFKIRLPYYRRVLCILQHSKLSTHRVMRTLFEFL